MTASPSAQAETPETSTPPKRLPASVHLSRDEHAPSGPLPVTIIEPQSGLIGLNLIEVWRYRDLLTLMVWRDISARYRQSIAGWCWAVFKPVLSMLIFTFVFQRVAGIEGDGVPYQLFAFGGLLPWMYFSGSLTNSSTSLVTGSALITKVYFPRVILPLAGLIVGLVELAIQLVILALLLVYYGVFAGWQVALAPAFVLAIMVCSMSVGLWLTALNVRYRDIGLAVPFLMQAWMWMSPVAYPSSLVPEKLKLLFALNPMAGAIEGFRWSLLGTENPDWTIMAVSFSATALLLVSGLYYFRQVEASFADVI